MSQPPFDPAGDKAGVEQASPEQAHATLEYSTPEHPTLEQTVLEHAILEWDADGQPLSSSFGDVYFSKANGLEETRHVFLHHNQLPERWRQLAEDSHFVIGETGFGSGLNFLAAWELWLETAPASAQLHFITVEKYPLNKADLTRALALWPGLKPLADLLIEAYPCFVGRGFHRLNFMDGRIKLTLIIDDAAEGFARLLASDHPLFERTGPKADAWFLDGFAPAKNPQMWSGQLFSSIGKLSCAGTTAATFSAAGLVKQGLRSAGFSVHKVAGFGRKREMVKAEFNPVDALPNQEAPASHRRFAAYSAPWTVNEDYAVPASKQALIIGGGLAGCHTARALAERGWQVTIADRQSALAQEGSGNPQGAVYAKLSPLDEAQAAFNLASLQYALAFYRAAWPSFGDRCGLLQIAHSPAEQRLQDLLREKFGQAGQLVEFVTAERASEITGTRLNAGGLFFPEAGWIDPRRLCHWLVDHPGIQLKLDTEVATLAQKDAGWMAHLANGGQLTASVVVLASAGEVRQLEQLSHLPVRKIRGQISILPQAPDSPALRSVVCAEGYIAPAQDGVFCTGATFHPNDPDTSVRAADHHTNLANLCAHLPDFAGRVSLEQLAGRVGYRCSLPDYLPCVGPVPAVDAMLERFAMMRKNARAGFINSGAYLPGLFTNLGHGARGLAYTPLCAELLAAQINNEPWPLARELGNALNPARFLIRDLMRNKR